MKFTQGDHVVVNEEMPSLAGETATVLDPDFFEGDVLVRMDNQSLASVGIFVPDELDAVEQEKTAENNS